jgi:hypothetical protein
MMRVLQKHTSSDRVKDTRETVIERNIERTIY